MGAPGPDRTDDLLITSELRYHCATEAWPGGELAPHRTRELTDQAHDRATALLRWTDHAICAATCETPSCVN